MNKCKGGFRVDSSFILPPSSFQEWSRSESNRDLDRARVGSCQLDDGPKSEPDAGFEPATQPWRGRVIKPLHQSGNKKTPKPLRVSGSCVLKKRLRAPHPLRMSCCCCCCAPCAP